MVIFFKIKTDGPFFSTLFSTYKQLFAFQSKARNQALSEGAQQFRVSIFCHFYCLRSLCTRFCVEYALSKNELCYTVACLYGLTALRTSYVTRVAC